MSDRIQKALVAEMEKHARAGAPEAQLAPEARAQIIRDHTPLLSRLFQKLKKPVLVAVQDVALQILRDLSRWNPVTDYFALAGTGAIALMIKATEGTAWMDQLAQTHNDGARASGMGRGFYHFARPELNQVTQADFFVGRVLEITGGEIPVVAYLNGQPVRGLALDFEITGGLSGDRLNSWIWGFVTRVHELTGHWPMIYTSPYVWSLVTGDKAKFLVCGLWIANWDVLAPYIPYPWSTIQAGPGEYKYLIWQNRVDPKGSVPGVPSAALDHNLTPMTKIPTAPPPDPEPDPEPQPGIVVECLAPAGWVNLRAGPGTQYADIGDMYAGQTGTVIEFDAPREMWVKIELEVGTVAWAAYRYNGTPLFRIQGAPAAANYSTAVDEPPKG